MKFQIQFRHRTTREVVVVGEGNEEDFCLPDGTPACVRVDGIWTRVLMLYVQGIWQQALDDKIFGEDVWESWGSPWLVMESPGSGFIPRDANGYLVSQEGSKC